MLLILKNIYMKYTKQYKIGFHQTDANFNLKPYEFFNMAQDAATEHCDLNNCGYPALIVKDLAWMLIKMNFEFIKMPVNLQDVVMHTWHKGQKGPVFYRDYILEDMDGNALIKGTSIWATVNVKSRSIARPEDMYLDDCIVKEDALDDRSLKVQIPDDLPMVAESMHKVQYSDVDCNRHANNTSYIIWALNALPYDKLTTSAVKSLQICYLSESKPMSDIKIQVFTSDNKEYGIKMLGEDGKALCHIRIGF